MSLPVLISDEVFAANEVDDVKGGDESIEKCGKLLKTGKLSKSENSKGEILSKSKKHLALEHTFILFRLVFTDIWIEENDSLRYSIQNSQYGALGRALAFKI